MCKLSIQGQAVKLNLCATLDCNASVNLIGEQSLTVDIRLGLSFQAEILVNDNVFAFDAVSFLEFQDIPRLRLIYRLLQFLVA